MKDAVFDSHILCFHYTHVISLPKIATFTRGERPFYSSPTPPPAQLCEIDLKYESEGFFFWAKFMDSYLLVLFR